MRACMSSVGKSVNRRVRWARGGSRESDRNWASLSQTGY